MANLNLVDTKVTIAGKPCHFVHLKLHQKFNSHHTFEIRVDYEQLDTLWMFNPVKMIQLMGEDVGITMQHRQTGEMNLFNGIITNISIAGKHGEQNYIVVSGCSPTIKLEGTPTMDSFMDLTLENIVQEAVKNSGNGGEVTVKPLYKGKIDFITEYNETCFEFLNRLSWLYGEWNFYDGTTHYFGKPDLGNAATIVYDEEMTHFDLSSHLIPPKVNRYEYLNHISNPIDLDTPDSVAGVRGYIKASLDQAKKIYTSDAVRPLEASIQSMKELEDMVKVDKYRMISRMLIMKGTTQTCKVKIGKLISVNLPAKMQVPLKHVETFLITQVTHDIDQDGTYINEFTAIPSEMENIPMQPIASPIALPQIAWVKSNADERGLGRVKVQTQWQKKLNKTTNWIRVQTPDAGSSEKVANNRGFVFIPEEGDLVMLGFENGDPNRPYVSGSMFAENISKGGGQGNKSKSLTTRSGSTVTLNDEDGSILIRDKSGSKSEINLDGEQNISIGAGVSFTIAIGKNNGKLRIDSDGNIELVCTNMINLTIGGSMIEMKDKEISISSETINIMGNQNNITGNTTIKGDKIILN